MSLLDKNPIVALIWAFEIEPGLELPLRHDLI